MNIKGSPVANKVLYETIQREIKHKGFASGK